MEMSITKQVNAIKKEMLKHDGEILAVFPPSEELKKRLLAKGIGFENVVKEVHAAFYDGTYNREFTRYYFLPTND